MDLREAIEASDRDCRDPCRVMTWYPPILAAAKRELEREELEREEKERPRLARIEESVRRCAGNVGPLWGSTGNHDKAADILKALRETVVPWLQQLSRLPEETAHLLERGEGVFYGGGRRGSAEDMLRALGEEP